MKYALTQAPTALGREIVVEVPDIDSEDYSTRATEAALSAALGCAVAIDDVQDYSDEGHHAVHLSADVPLLGGVVDLKAHW